MDKLKTLLGDPATGEVVVVLSDGKPRICKFDHKALRVLEETMHTPWYRAVGMPMSLLAITAMVYAGGFMDAQKRREPWSIEVVDALLEPRMYTELWAKLQWAIAYAVRPFVKETEQIVGELVPSRKGPKPRRSHGRRR